MDLEDKVAIVTGASKGIGMATARLFSQRGSKLVLAARSKDRLEKLSRELPNSLAVPTDMTKIEDITNMISKAVERFGRIDILVNNAGQGYDATVEEVNVDQFHYISDLDLLGPLIAMQLAVPYMRRQGGGAVVNVSSGLALMYLPGMGPYASLKRALAHFSLIAREELKGDNISVGVVYPFITSTDFEKNTLRSRAEDEDSYEGGAPYKPDTAEYVAEKIFEAVKSGEGEIFAHDWMKRQGK
jgi:short-subunit dehydrogenase